MASDANPLPLDLLTALRELVDVLEQAGIRYALIGGIAAGFHGRPRFTEDLDFLLEIPAVALPALVDRLRERGFSADVATVAREWSREHLTVLSYRGVRVDWLKPVIPLYQHVLDRARSESWLGGNIRISAPEGLILTKLLAFRTQDQLDIENLLIAHAGQLDLDFMRTEWLAVAPLDDPRWQWLEVRVQKGG